MLLYKEQLVERHLGRLYQKVVYGKMNGFSGYDLITIITTMFGIFLLFTIFPGNMKLKPD